MMNAAMSWEKLLSTKRLGKNKVEKIEPGRSPFQQDFDRIIFSSAFRRLQDKAQVFPLSDHDYVRTRLTHSLEASSIGRSLGAGAGVMICRHLDKSNPIQPSDIGAIVAAAALAHDIGNPPLGHSGEEAIRSWFAESAIAASLKTQMAESERSDIERYEGNAQGFRVLSRLQMPDNHGGMQLTCATLGAFIKYPCPSSLPVNDHKNLWRKKFNFFQLDQPLFEEVMQECGLLKISDELDSYARHPLAFLVEAADDISYRIIDFEDGHILHIIDYGQIEDLFLDIIRQSKDSNLNIDHIKQSLGKLENNERRVEFLRAMILGCLVKQLICAFEENHEKILQGKLNQPLINCIQSAEPLEKIITLSVDKIYTYRRAVEIEAAGFELTSGLLDAFVGAAEELAKEINGQAKASYRNKKLLQLLPYRFCPHENEQWRQSTYLRTMLILDYIAGMTDSYAVSLFKKIKGISLPGIIMN